jgi:hypothetical protein
MDQGRYFLYPDSLSLKTPDLVIKKIIKILTFLEKHVQLSAGLQQDYAYTKYRTYSCQLGPVYVL